LFAAPKLPRVAFGVDDLIKEFRGPLQLKISELSKNYIVHKTGYNASYKSHTNINCLWSDIPGGEVLAKVQMNFNLSENTLSESAYYTGCKDQLNLKELVVTTGTELAPITKKQFFKGERSFDLKKNETSKLYRLLAWDDVELFRLTIRRTVNGKIAEFFIREQRFMNATYTFSNEQSRVIYTFYGYNVSYTRKHSQWSMNRGRASYALKVIANDSGVSPVVYLNSDNTPIAAATFQRFFSFSVLQGTIARLADFIKWHNWIFPTTEFQATGVQNSRFLDELRLTFTRLLSNTDLNLVRNLIQEYIKSIEEGLLKVIDNRPKE